MVTDLSKIATRRFAEAIASALNPRKEPERGLQALCAGLGPLYRVSLRGKQSEMKARADYYFGKGWDVVVSGSSMTATIGVEVDSQNNPLSSPDLTQRMGSYREL
jgi:hypothetical protein